MNETLTMSDGGGGAGNYTADTAFNTTDDEYYYYGYYYDDHHDENPAGYGNNGLPSYWTSHHRGRFDDNDDDDHWNTSSSSNKNNALTARFVLFLMVILLFALKWHMSIRRAQREEELLEEEEERRRRQQQQTETDDDDQHNHKNYTIEERKLMYSIAFDKIGNQLTINDEHIVVRNNGENAAMVAAEGKENADEDATFVDVEIGEGSSGGGSDNHINDEFEEESRSMYLSIPPERFRRQSRVVEINTEKKKKKKNGSGFKENDINTGSSTSITIQSGDDGDNDGHNNSNKETDDNDGSDSRINVGGTCVICFEEYKKGDVVVWSASSSQQLQEDDKNDKTETSSCRHVYHKECMIQYLATHHGKKQQKNLNWLKENPCPTCRRNFATIDKDWLSLLPNQETANPSDDKI